MTAMKVILLLVGLVVMAAEAAPPHYAHYWQYFNPQVKSPALSEAIQPPVEHEPAETTSPIQPSSCVVEDQDKVDCAPWNNKINAQLCEAESCCWLRTDTPDVPWCFYGMTTASQCQTDERVECGHVGITQQECEDGGCCWSPSPVRGQPWCFQEIEVAANIQKPESAEDTKTPPPSKEIPAVGPKAKGCLAEERDMVDCGYYMSTQQECEADGCCWRESDIPGLPWCFYKVTAATQCQVDPAEREACGSIGMKPEECENAGCCWSATGVSGAPWCYQEKRETYDFSRVLPSFFGYPE